MKDLTKRKDVLAVLLILLVVLLVKSSISGSISGAVVGVSLDRDACFDGAFGSCGKLCIEKSNDEGLADKLPSDWLDSCLDDCEKTAVKDCR